MIFGTSLTCLFACVCRENDVGLDGRWQEWRVSMECGRILILPADDPLHFSTLAFSAFRG